MPVGSTVVGITAVESKHERGFSLDACHLYKPTWSDQDQALVDEAKERFGFFKRPTQTCVHEDEYPTGTADVRTLNRGAASS
jgi:hypothetical protein